MQAIDGNQETFRYSLLKSMALVANDNCVAFAESLFAKEQHEFSSETNNRIKAELIFVRQNGNDKWPEHLRSRRCLLRQKQVHKSTTARITIEVRRSFDYHDCRHLHKMCVKVRCHCVFQNWQIRKVLHFGITSTRESMQMMAQGAIYNSILNIILMCRKDQ